MLEAFGIHFEVRGPIFGGGADSSDTREACLPQTGRQVAMFPNPNDHEWQRAIIQAMGSSTGGPAPR